MPRPQYAITTERQYKGDLDLLSAEIESAAIIYHTSEEMNRLAIADPAIFRALNREAQFWQGYRSTGQTSLFVTLGRIFDHSNDAHSIHKVVAATIEHWQFFTRTALRSRKLDGHADEPEWLDDFVALAWVPAGPNDLEFLRAELEPRAQRFKDTYQPIRNNVIGHRLMTDDHAAVALFPQTNRNEVGELLDFLHALIDGLIHLYNNGTQPTLAGYDFTNFNQHVRAEVQRVLTRLAN